VPWAKRSALAVAFFAGLVLVVAGCMTVGPDYVLVAGINQVKRHTRPNPMKNQPGGIVTKEVPIHVSNVAIWNPVTLKADRVGFRMLEDGRKVRFFKSNGEVIGA